MVSSGSLSDWSRVWNFRESVSAQFIANNVLLPTVKMQVCKYYLGYDVWGREGKRN